MEGQYDADVDEVESDECYLLVVHIDVDYNDQSSAMPLAVTSAVGTIVGVRSTNAVRTLERCRVERSENWPAPHTLFTNSRSPPPATATSLSPVFLLASVASLWRNEVRTLHSKWARQWAASRGLMGSSLNIDLSFYNPPSPKSHKLSQ